MPLLAFLASNPKEVAQLAIEQVVAMAGDGVLKDNSACSTELRDYLRQADSELLGRYVERCLSAAFSNSGLVLQDLVNELGRRLDYRVTNGRYRGVQGAVGADGIWTSPEGHAIVAEVKTTDAYTVNLDVIAAYRTRLLESAEIKSPSSALIVVGRQKTSEIEAQIRGSRHAWDIRVISVESLLKVVQLKENSEEPETGRKIRSLLAPMEFTRLDGLVDIMFTTVTDVEAGLVEVVAEAVEANSDLAAPRAGTWEFTDPQILDRKRMQIVDAFSRKLGSKLIKKSRALFWDASHSQRIACSISKRYSKGAAYWYAYHPKWDEFLGDGRDAYFVLGCVDLQDAYAVPLSVMRRTLDALNTTTTDNGTTYWHVHLVETATALALVLPGRGQLPLNEYKIAL